MSNKKEWRPEGWVNPYLQQDDAGNYIDSKVFDAGADAILEALRKHATVHLGIIHNTTVIYPFEIHPPAFGVIVFIPDDEESN
jgi:hypothetical protein